MIVWKAFLIAFSVLLPLINPLGSALVFLGLVGDAPPKVLHSLARRIAISNVIFLAIFELIGATILNFFGISLPIVELSGGMVVAAMGNYITCRGCHSLLSFGGPNSHMKLVIHQGMVQADSYNCLECHSNIGHVYAQPSVRVDGWYSVEQADAGMKLFEQSCSGCHGAKLEGGAGPALNGAAWKQKFGGAKLLTVWGIIKGPMAGYAGRTFTTQQSLDILAYLLQQNGLAAGSQPLASMRELSDTLPEK